MFCICFRGFSQDYIDSSTYYHNLGVEVLLKGNPQLALISLNKANSLNPNNEFTLYNMGVCYHELKDYKKALRFYKKANKVDPVYLSAFNGMTLQFH